jgi:hypothetical protein
MKNILIPTSVVIAILLFVYLLSNRTPSPIEINQINYSSNDHKTPKYSLNRLEKYVENTLKLNPTGKDVCREIKENFGLDKFYKESESSNYVANRYGNASIEPLTFSLRHPRVACDRTYLMDQDYLVTNQKLCENKKTILFDIGASVWNGAADFGVSQVWLYNKFKNCDIQEFYLWEVTSDVSVYKDVPPKLLPIYHYNFRTFTNQEMIFLFEKYYQTHYMIVKLDIDTPHIEQQFIDLIFSINKNYIDEFFFEYHVDSELMIDSWATAGHPITNYDSFQFFKQLREKGIIAHSWV